MLLQLELVLLPLLHDLFLLILVGNLELCKFLLGLLLRLPNLLLKLPDLDLVLLGQLDDGLTRLGMHLLDYALVPFPLGLALLFKPGFVHFEASDLILELLHRLLQSGRLHFL